MRHPGRKRLARRDGGALALHRLACVHRGGFGHARIQVGVADRGLRARAQLARQRQLQPARALRADGDQHRWADRVGGLDARAFELEERCGGRGAAVQQVELAADLVVGAALRRDVGVGRRQREHLARGLVGAADRRVVRLHAVGLPHQAQARAPGGVGAGEVALARQAVVGRLAEAVVAQAGQHLPLRRDGDLVLHVEAARLVAVERAAVELAAAVERHHGQHRVEQVHGGDGAVREAQRVLVLLPQLHAVEQLVLDVAGAQVLDQLGLVEHAVLEAVDARARERHGAGDLVDGPTGQGVLPVQLVVVIAQRVAQAQAAVETVLEGGGERAHRGFGGVRIARVGRAEVRAGRHIHRPPAQGGNAEVRHPLIAQPFGLQQQRGVRIGLPEGRGRDRLALEELLAAVAVGVFGSARQSPRPVAAGRGAAQVEFAAPVGPAAHREGYVGDMHARLLGHAVDQPARGAAPVEHGGRALDDLHAVDVGEIAEIQRIVAEAVHELVADAGEAADAHLVALAVARGQAHAGHVAQRVLQRGRTLVAQHLARHHVDGLRHVAQGGLGLGAAGRSGRVVGRIVRAAVGLHAHLAHRGHRSRRCLLRRRGGAREAQGRQGTGTKRGPQRLLAGYGEGERARHGAVP